MTWMVVQNGQIVKGWDGWDSTGLLVQCGVPVTGGGAATPG